MVSISVAKPGSGQPLVSPIFTPECTRIKLKPGTSSSVSTYFSLSNGSFHGNLLLGRLRGFTQLHVAYVAFGDFIPYILTSDVTKIENNRIYVIVARESGIHVKYLQPEDQRVLCIPANLDEFEPYHLEADDIREIWGARVKVTSRIVDQLAGSSGNTDKKLRSLEEFLKGKFPDLIVTE
ncbi:hypothetical protein Halhy_2249 [Haliscomenobacter hydrossis DSM 1100]|uniref:Uncharacterized protein n=1 Tax=Haliscomenobacter hydrossis (strain ATCC 27775 / DSM 1100 / LMG 10767 / O) TaxID=760192 RepID=F4KT60_HALH1|nr:hypothetical protein Halhy_2249 [Haliscomenobacter hydrossis DSM 1100]